MGLFDKLLGGKRPRASAAERLAEAIGARSAVPFAEARLTPAATGPAESKVGGAPYAPAGFEWPTDLTEGFEARPLAFLAQLNFEEMPPLEGFPRRGILQFYISDGEHYGMDFERPARQRGFRVVFHENADAPSAGPSAEPGALLQLASAEDGECSVRWGEGGTCVFLARPEDVAKGDFSNVLYHWDGN